MEKNLENFNKGERIYKSGRSEPLSYAISNIGAMGEIQEITRILPMNNGEFFWEIKTK